MAITMKLRQLITEAAPALKKIAEAKFKGKVRLRLTRLLIAVKAEEEIWKATRISLIEAYDHKQDDGSFQVPEEQMPDFTKQVNEIMDDDVELNVGPLKLSLLGNTEVEPVLLANLGSLLEDDEDPDEEPAAAPAEEASDGNETTD